jgi:hypothetical protein
MIQYDSTLRGQPPVHEGSVLVARDGPGDLPQSYGSANWNGTFLTTRGTKIRLGSGDPKQFTVSFNPGIS